MTDQLGTEAATSPFQRAFKRPQAISKFTPKQLKIASAVGAALIVVASVYSFAPMLKTEIPSDVALISPKAPDVESNEESKLTSVSVDEKGNPIEAVSAASSAVSAMSLASAPITQQVITEPPPTEHELLKQTIATLERVESQMDKILVTLATNNQKMTDLDKKILKAGTGVSQPRKDRTDFSSLSIYDVSPSGVVVGDGSKKLVVHPGQKLPGGATFIGFDPTTRTLKTDVGDFMIPS